jgi:branched-chain amino acid transport system substrate-binding protein
MQSIAGKFLCRTFAASVVLASAIGSGAAQDTIKIGYAISKTGPNAPGASITTLPNYQLWIKEVNDAGGIKVGDKMMKLEVVEYDDRSSAEELVRAVERLATQDKVDLILSPWGTGMNLAVGPTMNKYGYPHLAATAATDRAYEMGERWPNSFWMLGTSTMGANALVEVLTKLHDAGQINENVAMASIADAFGIELSNAARPALEKAGFKVVMDESYPLATQDFSPIIDSAAASGADTFVAFSYPPDTFGLTDAAIVRNYNPKAFYTAVGTAFPIYIGKYGKNAEGVLGIGGVNPDDPKFQDYLKRHKEVTGAEPDRWASPVTYASLQMLQQAIERVGSLDKAAIIKELQSGTFDTVIGEVKLDKNVNTMVWWAGQWQGGEFYGLAPTSMAGAHDVMAPKPAWQAQ